MEKKDEETENVKKEGKKGRGREYRRQMEKGRETVMERTGKGKEEGNGKEDK